MCPAVCRACLLPDAGQYSVMEDVVRVGFEELTGILVKSEDGLPQTVCGGCMSHFAEFSRFRKKVLASHENLMDGLKDAKPATDMDGVKIEVTAIKNEPTAGTEPEYLDLGLLNSEDNMMADEDESVNVKIEKKNKIKRKTRKGKKIHRTFVEVDPDKIKVIKIKKDEQLRNHKLEADKPAFLAMPYKCEKCYKGFNYERKLKAHLEMYHKPNSQYQCSICCRTLSTAASLALHMHRHELLYECRACSANFAEKRRAMEHYSSVHEGIMTELPCSYCDKVFRHRSTLNGHIRNHHQMANRPRCDVCGKVFVNKDSLDDHLLIHTGERNYPCDVCGKRFRIRAELKSHLRSHSSARSHYCTDCDVQFKSRGSYMHHLKYTKNHIGNVKYICQECGRTFGTLTTLRAHRTLRAEHAESGASCPKCALVVPACSMSAHLRRHYRKPGDRKYVCHVCAHMFSNRRLLENHIRIHTGEKPFACEVCGSRFTQKSTLNTHIKLVHLKIKRKTVEMYNDANNC